MNFLVTGIHGFVGQEVKAAFEGAGHSVRSVPRDILMTGGEPLQQIVSGADAIVNLAGASIMGRWTRKKKHEIMESRRISTRNLVTAVNGLEKKPGLFINASAVGIYQPDTSCDEDSQVYSGYFLGQVVKAWEEELKGLTDVRKVVLRFGLVVGKNGGLLKRLLPLIKARIAVVIGEGLQDFPLIHVGDIAGFILWSASREKVAGIYNLVIPEEPIYREFVVALGQICKPWLTVVIPEWCLKLAMGESAEVLTKAAHVVPRRLAESGYLLKYGTVDEVIRGCL